jgi:acyl-CoA reductase-like NAD-dependent aldehyde dehydrogenase
MAIVQPVVGSGGSRRLRVSSPVTREPIGEIEVNTAEQVAAAVGRARAAQTSWAALSIDQRTRVMRRALKILLARQEQFITVITSETGRSRHETLMMEILPACDALAYWAKRAKRALADDKPALHLLKTKKLIITYRPLGVVGIITPWNGPFILSLNPTVQALMAGNAVIVKPSEVTPFSGRLVAELFRDAGLPADVLTVLEGDGETGAALVEAGVDKISFTGSVRTGRRIGEVCGRRLIPCTLELGGKDAAIVCADADLDRAAKGVVFGAFMNSGQFCCSTERLYVVDSVADQLITKVVREVQRLRLGSSGDYDLGPAIWPSQLELIERHVDDARRRGATVLLGGRRSGELFYEPTVLTNVTHDMAIMREETFGPVLPIVRVADEGEALRLANDSEYGLSGTIWSKDEARAIALARKWDTGSVCVNESSITYGALEAPFGGRKASGVGQVNGADGLRSYCYAQPIVVDRFGAREEHVWYPYSLKKARLLQRTIRVIWGTPLGRWLS